MLRLEPTGRRTRGRAKMRFRDVAKEDFKSFGVKIEQDAEERVTTKT